MSATGRGSSSIRRGLVVLVAVMPFHALLVITLGHWLGHEAIWQSWKEILILSLGLIAVWSLLTEPRLANRWQSVVAVSAIAYIIYALAASTMASGFGSTAWLFGVKTNLVMVGAFLLGLLVSSRPLSRSLRRIVISASALVASLAILQVFLPPRWLVALGYNASTINPVQRVDPAVGVLRVFSTLGGPNQLGAFLILPICLLVNQMARRFRWWQPALLLLLGAAETLTFSRSAWLGLVAALLVTIAALLKPRQLVIFTFGTILAIALGVMGVNQLIKTSPTAQYYLLHSTARDTGLVTSDAQHRASLLAGIERVQAHSAGYGLGTAGPASKYSAQPFYSENYYIQIAIESGVAGLALYLLWQLVVAGQLWRLRLQVPMARPLLGTLVGVAVVNLLLHGWTDSTLALVFWPLAGAIAGARQTDAQ